MIQGTMPVEDSENLTDEEISASIPTVGQGDFASHMANAAKDLGSPLSHELLRRAPQLYCRTTFTNKILLFRVSWLQ